MGRELKKGRNFEPDASWRCRIGIPHIKDGFPGLIDQNVAASDSPRACPHGNGKCRLSSKKQASSRPTNGRRGSRSTDPSLREEGRVRTFHLHHPGNLTAVLRNAAAYACIRRKPVQIRNIRGKRPVPGLKQQHLSGLQLLERVSGGSLDGGRIQSSEILFRPGKDGIMEAEFTSDQGGGGCTTPNFSLSNFIVPRC